MKLLILEFIVIAQLTIKLSISFDRYYVVNIMSWPPTTYFQQTGIPLSPN